MIEFIELYYSKIIFFTQALCYLLFLLDAPLLILFKYYHMVQL